jgi:hypothetical protein
VTYTYTPAAVPEASTWAMMLEGFAGLSCAAVRRKGARRSVLGSATQSGSRFWGFGRG